MRAELIVDYACELGEGPLWHSETGRLLWTDINAGTLYYFEPEAGAHGVFHQGRPTGGFTIQQDGSLLLFHDRGGITRLAGREAQIIVEAIPEEWDSRFNDVQADLEGRVFCGTMASSNRGGSLYRLEHDGTVIPVLRDLGTPNGMGFTPDGSGMYFTHTTPGEIWLYRYNRETGEITDGNVFAHADGPGRPDGLCVDAEGCVWSARYEGSCVVRYNPDGEEILKIDIPTRRVTSLTFGGDDLGTLFITTAGGNDKTEHGEFAGALFAVLPGVKGVPEPRSAVML